MKTNCERCAAELAESQSAFVCSYECTFCANCTSAMNNVCPNCGGELVARPRRGEIPASETASSGIAEPQPMEAYRPRRISFDQVVTLQGWRLKVYEITSDENPIDRAVVEAAIRFVETAIAWPDDSFGQFGFMTLHRGEQATWLLVDLWSRDILKHFLYYASLDAPLEFRGAPPDGTCACVWELQVTMHEREAWISHVLSEPADPDFEGYLENTLASSS